MTMGKSWPLQKTTIPSAKTSSLVRGSALYSEARGLALDAGQPPTKHKVELESGPTSSGSKFYSHPLVSSSWYLDGTEKLIWI